MAHKHQRGWLKKEKPTQGETWVLFFRIVRKSDGKRVENKIPIGLVKDFPEKSLAWSEVQKQHFHINQVDFRGCLTFSDLAQHQVGVVRDEAAAQDLIAAGVPQLALVPQSSNADVLRLLESKRVDAMVDTEVSMQWNLRQTALAPTAIVKRMKLSDEGAYYFALNLDSDPALATKLQDAVHKLRRDGKIDAIARRYGATSKIK